MRPSLLLLLAVGMLLPLQPAHGTSPCEGLDRLAKEITDMRDGNPNGGVDVGTATLAALRRSGDTCPAGEALLLAAIGSNLHILGRNTEALAHFEDALATLGEDPEPGHLALVHRGLGVVHSDLDAYDRALENYLASLAASEAMDDPIEAAKTSSNIGNLYNSLGRLDEAREFHLRALARFEEADWELGIAGTLINLGSLSGRIASAAAEEGDVATAREENEKLRDHNIRALGLFEEMGNRRGIAYASNNIATALDRLGDPSAAMPYHRRAMELRTEIGDVFGQINSLNTMASSLIRLGEYDEAEELLEHAGSVLPENQTSLAHELAGTWVALEEARGNLAEALERQREVTRLRVEMGDEEARGRVEQLRVAFETEQREKEIELLRSTAKVSDLQLARQRLLIQVVVALIVLLTILIAVLVSRYRLRIRATRELDRVARTDPLTGLSNRRDVQAHIGSARRHYQRTGETFSVILADIDDFKPINDTLGHDAGDQVLVHLARVLQSRTRARDLVSRWGGEEFLIFLPHTRAIGAGQLAESIRKALAESPVQLQGQTISLTLTLGIAEYKPPMSTEDLIKAADQAMYIGKARGKNQIVLVDQEQGA